MAVAVDASTSGGILNNTSSFSWSHTCSGSNRVLVVMIALYSTSVTISSITYNSNALTLYNTLSTTNVKLHIYYLIAPSTGTNTLSISLSGSTYGFAGAISFTGAAQSSPLGGDQTTTSGIAGSSTVTVSADANKMCCQVTGVDGGGCAISFTVSGQTAVVNTSDNNFMEGVVTYASGSASVTMTTTGSRNGNNWAEYGFYVSEFVASSVNKLALLGVG